MPTWLALPYTYHQMIAKKTTLDTRDVGLDALLDLDGYIIDQDGGYWVKIEVAMQEPTTVRPHGIKYSLSLHEPYGNRIMGYDNAHAVKDPKKGKYSGRRVEYDHLHRHALDKGVPYEFVDAYQLLKDFFADVDRALEAHRKG